MRTIYALEASDELGIRYIGQTGASLHQRLRGHINTSKAKPGPLSTWVLDTAERGALRIRPLMDVDDHRADALERQMIFSYRRTGLLLNVRDGWRGKRDRALIRPIVVSSDNGRLLITCPSLPAVTTYAMAGDEIVRRANDAIEEALAASV